MTRALSNKALATLAVLQEVGECTCQALADAVRERTPCGTCGGTGEGEDSHYGCRRCYGRGRVPYSYSDAYQALVQLEHRGLVARRHLLNEWGDKTRQQVWRASEPPQPADELEALYLAPSAEEPGA